MSLFCKIFGHSFTTAIYNGKWDSEYYSVSHSKRAFCKRCGVGLNEINNEVKDESN